MARFSIPLSSLLGWLSFVGVVSAPPDARGQDEGPEPPMPPPVSSTGDEAFTDLPSSTAGARSSEPTEPELDDPWAAEAKAPLQEEPRAASLVAGAETPEEQYERWYRKTSLHEQNTIFGSTGLHRVRRAGSGAPGTFRFGLTGSFFMQSGFLCTSDAACRDPITGLPTGQDDAQRIEALATLSVTPLSFLEAYLTVRNSATSNSNGRPQLLQVVGDSSLGVKAFSPSKPDRYFYYGGEAELGLLTGTGGVGLNGGATSFALRALGTLDLNNRFRPEDRFPLRAHVNLGYFFDNSAAVVQSLESTPPPQGRGSPIERTERYGLNISRVDAFEVGLGVEYIHDYVRPFIEWTVDVPVNRQGYVCNVQGAAGRGDRCLGLAAGLDTSPNRFTFGARVFPWQASGLALNFALDVGTGGTRSFLEETTPESPYALWFGLAYAVDTTPVPPRVVQAPPAAAPRERVRRFVVGRVVDVSGEAAIPDAILRFQDPSLTGLVANAEGFFRTSDLPPGRYELRVFAEQYREGTCSVEVPESVDDTVELIEPAPSEIDPYGDPTPRIRRNVTLADRASGVVRNADGDLEIPLTCELKELPRVANVTGLLVDASTGGPVQDATVTITDKLFRSLTLEADAQGSLLFQNVPFGVSRLTASAPGYLTTVLPITVDSRKDLEIHVVMNRRPERLEVEVGPRELKLARPITFVGETAELGADSMFLVEQIAAVLRENTKIGAVEIQVHSDDAGAASYSRRLTQDRAETLRSLLVQLGVEESRLVAKGYGPDQPLVPNVSDANRAKNRRVQLLVTQGK